MIRSRYILLSFCLALAVTLIACEKDTIIVGPTAEGIQVTGTGSAFGSPDIAILSLGVVAEEKTVDKAQDSAASAMQQVIDSLETNGVAESDIQTSQFNIRPVYDYNDSQRTLRGYEVSNIVTVKVRAMDDTGQIIDDVVTAGGKWTQINSIRFDIDDPKDLKEQAREAAMTDARARAETLAELGGVTLGKPVSISESMGNGPIYRYESGLTASADAATPIEPGELEITVTVSVIYEIE